MTVYGIFPAAEAAETAMQALKLAGLSEADISVLFTGNVGSAPLEDERISDERAAADVAARKDVAPSLAELGLPDDLAVAYGKRLSEGAVLLAARVKEGQWTTQAKSIMTHAGAEEIACLKSGGMPASAEEEERRRPASGRNRDAA